MKKILLVVMVLAVFAGGYGYYLGLFHTLEVKEEEVGPFYLLYETQVGEYRQTGDTVHRISEFLEQRQIVPKAGFGIYYDDPRTVPEEKLRSEAGVLVQPEDRQKVESIKGDYEFREFPKTPSLVTELPFRNMLSIFVGVFKAYPTLEKYAQKHEIPVSHSIEIYEMDQKIRYLMPIQKY